MWPSYYLKASKGKIKVISYAYFRICKLLERPDSTDFQPKQPISNAGFDLEVTNFENQFIRASLFRNIFNARKSTS